MATQKLSHCGRCRTVQYCSVEHQREDWPGHKVVCKQLARAAADLAERTAPPPSIPSTFPSEPVAIISRYPVPHRYLWFGTSYAYRCEVAYVQTGDLIGPYNPD